jgi:hypothetical protein
VFRIEIEPIEAALSAAVRGWDGGGGPRDRDGQSRDSWIRRLLLSHQIQNSVSKDVLVCSSRSDPSPFGRQGGVRPNEPRRKRERERERER